MTILGGSLNLDTWPDGTHVTMYIDPKQKVWFINVGKDQEFQEKALKMLKLSATLWRANDQPSKHLPPERRSRAPFLKQQPPRHAASSQRRAASSHRRATTSRHRHQQRSPPAAAASRQQSSPPAATAAFLPLLLSWISRPLEDGALTGAEWPRSQALRLPD